MDNGLKMRMDILRGAADQQIIKPLRTHGWNAEISSEHGVGEYLIIRATRQEVENKVALLYSSATDNRHYRRMAEEVSHIFTNGALYMVESFAYGIDIPVTPIEDFFPVMAQWNRQIAPSSEKKTYKPVTKSSRRITAENPLDGVWAHLNQLASVKLSEKLIWRRASSEGVELQQDQILTKSLGVAFCIRSATDYFRGMPHESTNKRVLSLYYGCLALASAEMLASPNGCVDLDQVEGMTRFGHGLFTLPSTSGSLGDLVVGVLASGFFPQWMHSLGHDVGSYPKSKPKSPSDLQKLAPTMHTTLGALLASLPEVSDILDQVYALEPSWLSAVIDHESSAPLVRRRTGSTYVHFFDQSKKIERNRLETAPWPIAELTLVKTERDGTCYRARVDHPDCEYWHQALPLHRSPFFEGSTLILPVLSDVVEHRAISMSVLYALSILVRYMPSAWRRVEGGDWDENLALMKTSLNMMERMLPQQFLESITGERIASRLPGGLF